MNQLVDTSPNELVEQQDTSTSVAVAAQQSREQAEIQSALLVAANRPRNEMACIDAIRNACQRPRLAEKAEYSYSKGGQAISGANITLLTEIARHWGNIKFGFRELSRSSNSSEVEAYAWDLETNTKRDVLFTVKHRIDVRNGTKQLTSDRDIYEWISNQAQRRVRTCLESVIPRDIVEDARDECKATLKANVDMSPDAIKKMLTAFQDTYRVTQEMVEARLQRRVDAITPAQFLSLRSIYRSLTDGMSKPSDWFTMPGTIEEPSAPTEPSKGVETLMEAAVESETTQPANALSLFCEQLGECKTQKACKELYQTAGNGQPDDVQFEMSEALDRRISELKS